MSDLLPHRKNLQTITELVKFTLGVDVFVVDDQMIAMAGTGPYRTNIGTKRPRDSYVDVTISQGDSQTVIDPRYTHQCYRCEYRSLCPYSMVMCRPLISNNHIKGLIGFLGFSESQRQNMIARSSFLCDLSERLNYIWDTANLDLHDFLRHPHTRAFIDFFEQGLVLTDNRHQVINLNERAERFLNVNRDRITGRHLTRILGGERLPSDPVSLLSGAGESHIHREFSLTGEDGPAARVMIISDKSEPRQTWKGCPLTSPAMSMIVGTSKAIIHLREMAANVARSDSRVLITGETGVGKELAARYIHQMSCRWAGPFETVNCAAIPESLFESEFFGYAPGAFTGAGSKGKTGKFPAAHGGTIFLDEVSRLSLPNQAKILRILEDGLVQRLGDEKRRQVDVRVLAATNIDLEEAVAQNRFLPDLYYRLAVIPLSVPPLRERTEDIPLLLEYFTTLFQESLPETDFCGFAEDVADYLLTYDWPGNVRELKNMVEYVMNVVRGRQVEFNDLPMLRKNRSLAPPRPRSLNQPAPASKTGSERLTPLKVHEKEQIRLALDTYGHHTAGKRQAARHLGISLSTLYRRLAQNSPPADASPGKLP
jgi:sigma-54 dependent transcriptional regulator, acetoin dehydrogenase operon transcriptional activator AcoR